jgi:hypothetical protein
VASPLIPSPADLAAELTELLRGGVTINGLRNCSSVLALPLARAKSASDDAHDLAVAAHTLITEAAIRADGGAAGAATRLLGLAPGTRGSLLKDRRRWAAEVLHVSVEHLRKDREPLLLEAVADELYGADSAFRLRQRHRIEPERSPEQSGLRVDWLAQHRSYRRVWTPLCGARNDLNILRRYLDADDVDEAAIADRLCSLSWYWAMFLIALTRFVQEQGGLWLLADAESEIAAADAIYKVQFYAPLGEADNSWLRTLLADTEHEELDGFSDRLVAAGERRQELMAAWVAWASQCDDEGDADDCTCSLHVWLRAAEQFIRLIDEDWYRVADYYRASEVDPSGVDVREL